MVEVKNWVKEHFSKIENKNLGEQDFAKVKFSRYKNSNLSDGEMPHRGNEHELIFFNSYTDIYKMTIAFSLPNWRELFQKKSMNLLTILVAHKSPGSLYQCLKGLNYISSISCD